MRVSPQAAAIYEVLKQRDDWQSTTEIAEQANLSQTTVRHICRKLTERKILDCYQHLLPKRYRLADPNGEAAMLLKEAAAILANSQKENAL